MMKSNSDPAIMTIPRKVDKVPLMTGENTCSRDIRMRLLRDPIVVRKPCNAWHDPQRIVPLDNNANTYFRQETNCKIIAYKITSW